MRQEDAAYCTFGAATPFDEYNSARFVRSTPCPPQLSWRLSDDAIHAGEDEEWHDPAVRSRTRCTIWLSFTSNMVSSGVREIIRYIVEHRLVDVIVTSAGAVEEDIMKTLRPHYIGSFELAGRDLRARGINRLGNLLVPNLNYVAFEDWFSPLLHELHDEQEKTGTIFTPSMIVDRMGARVDDRSSIWYWAHKHEIPVFCPGITDGAIGDMLYFHLWKRAGFVVDVARDVRRINDISVKVGCAAMYCVPPSQPGDDSRNSTSNFPTFFRQRSRA